MRTRHSRGHNRHSTVLKYTNCLKEALIEIDKDPYFIPSIFIKTKCVTGSFINVIKSLGYITLCREDNSRVMLYKTCVHHSLISIKDGELIAQEILIKNSKWLYNRNGLYKENENNNDIKEIIKPIFNSTLNLNFSDQELINELKRRGYSGEISKTKSIKF
jgi:hypothetical protein